jgi:hypothetical protein
MAEEVPPQAAAEQATDDVELSTWYGSICHKCSASLEHGSEFKSLLGAFKTNGWHKTRQGVVWCHACIAAADAAGVEVTPKKERASKAAGSGSWQGDWKSKETGKDPTLEAKYWTMHEKVRELETKLGEVQGNVGYLLSRVTALESKQGGTGQASSSGGQWGNWRKS